MNSGELNGFFFFFRLYPVFPFSIDIELKITPENIKNGLECSFLLSHAVQDNN